MIQELQNGINKLILEENKLFSFIHDLNSCLACIKIMESVVLPQEQKDLFIKQINNKINKIEQNFFALYKINLTIKICSSYNESNSINWTNVDYWKNIIATHPKDSNLRILL